MAVKNSHINAYYLRKTQENRRFLFEFITDQAAPGRPAHSKYWPASLSAS
jgi:hypothetical protein